MVKNNILDISFGQHQSFKQMPGIIVNFYLTNSQYPYEPPRERLCFLPYAGKKATAFTFVFYLLSTFLIYCLDTETVA